MRSFRIHSLTPRFDGSIPYVAVVNVDSHRVQFCFDHLDDGLEDITFCLSLASIYTLLEGKCITVDLPFLVCNLTPSSDSVRVDLEVQGAMQSHSYCLALGELALAWNLISAGPYLF